MNITRRGEGSRGGPIDKDGKEGRVDKGGDSTTPLMDKAKGKKHLFYKILAELVEGF